MTLREQLRRAKPTVDSPTYRRLTGTTSEKEYQKQLQEERARLGLSASDKQADSSQKA